MQSLLKVNGIFMQCSQFILYDYLSENIVIPLRYLHEAINSDIFVL